MANAYFDGRRVALPDSTVLNVSPDVAEADVVYNVENNTILLAHIRTWSKTRHRRDVCFFFAGALTGVVGLITAVYLLLGV